MKRIFEIDLGTEIQASVETKCDNCGKKLGESWPRGKDTMTAQLQMENDAEGYPVYKTHHFCGEACLRDHLNSRAEACTKKS